MDRGGYAFYRWTEAVLHFSDVDRGGFARFCSDRIYHSRLQQEQSIVHNDHESKVSYIRCLFKVGFLENIFYNMVVERIKNKTIFNQV